MYQTIEFYTEVNFKAKNKKERKNTLEFLNKEFPPNSTIGITVDNETKEIWLLEWNSVKVNNEYIIGGRGVAVDSNQEYILKPISKLMEK